MIWAKVVLIFLIGFSCLSNICDHGKPKAEKYNAWSGIIGLAVYGVLFYYAGVFDLSR